MEEMKVYKPSGSHEMLYFDGVMTRELKERALACGFCFDYEMF
jgi:hypothetical protein